VEDVLYVGCEDGEGMVRIIENRKWAVKLDDLYMCIIICTKLLDSNKLLPAPSHGIKKTPLKARPISRDSSPGMKLVTKGVLVNLRVMQMDNHACGY
jgi:hypothetical protein